MRLDEFKKFEMKVKYRIFIFRVSRLGNDVPMSFNVSVFLVFYHIEMVDGMKECKIYDSRF